MFNMARFADREQALALRLNGNSYSQIKAALGVSKGTLSYWLRDYPLSENRIRELRDHSAQRIERYRMTIRKKKEIRYARIMEEQKARIFPLTDRDLFIAGFFIYWGEGSKQENYRIAISNTDPSMLRFFMQWLLKFCKIKPVQIKIALQIYSDMDEEEEVQYWMNELGLQRSNFKKSYIKQSTSTRINHKGSFGHGTCKMIVYGRDIFERSILGLKSIVDSFRASSSAG